MVLELPVKELTVKCMSTKSFQNDAPVITVLCTKIVLGELTGWGFLVYLFEHRDSSHLLHSCRKPGAADPHADMSTFLKWHP